MNSCDNCTFTDRPPYKSPCSECVDFDKWNEKEKPKTNADHIRSMSDEKLADLLYNFGMSNIVDRGKTEIAMSADKYHIELWLREPYKEKEE